MEEFVTKSGKEVRAKLFWKVLQATNKQTVCCKLIRLCNSMVAYKRHILMCFTRAVLLHFVYMYFYEACIVAIPSLNYNFCMSVHCLCAMVMSNGDFLKS